MKLGAVVLVALTLAVISFVVLRRAPPSPPSPVTARAPLPVNPPAPIPISLTPVDPALRDRVLAIVDRLWEAIKNADLEAQSRIQDELHALGFPVVEPLRVTLLANPEHRDLRLQQAVVRVLSGLASGETSLELLKSWLEVDQAKHSMKLLPAVFVLGQYAPVVAKRPGPELPKRLLADFAAVKTRDVKISLIQLMAQLLRRFPELRKELERIMVEDADPYVRGEAIAALSSVDPEVALPSMLKRMESLLVEASRSNKLDATKELMCLVDFLVVALPPDQVLDRLKELSDKVEGVYAVNHMSTMGMALGWKIGKPGEAGFEILLTRGSAETSRNMQLIYLGTLAGVSLQPNPDPRATDLALAYLDKSEDEWVRSHALSKITALNRDEATVLGAIERALKGDGHVGSTGGMQLAFYYYVKNPASTGAFEMIQRHATTGDAERRRVFLRKLCVSSVGMPPDVREVVKTISESDPDPKVRETATNVLNWTGGPPPR